MTISMTINAAISMTNVNQYNVTDLPQGPDRLFMLMSNLFVKRFKILGCIVFDEYGHQYDEFSQVMSQWLKQQKITYYEDLVEGLENTVESFIGLLEGKNLASL